MLYRKLQTFDITFLTEYRDNSNNAPGIDSYTVEKTVVFFGILCMFL